MSDLVRVSLSLEKEQYELLERLVNTSNCRNRSEFIRDLIREHYVQQQWASNEEVVGTITLVYNHHKHHLSNDLISLQHDHCQMVMATTHVHLSHDLCVEMILARGQAQKINYLADQLRQQKGVLHATLAMSSTGGDLP